MAGTTKLMTPGGGGVALTPASSIASDVTVNLPVTGVNNGTLVCSDSSGNVGIGTSSPASRLHVRGTTTGISGSSITMDAGAQQHFWYLSDNTTSTFQINSGAGVFRWVPTGSTEAMRIDSSGRLLLGFTSPLDTSYAFNLKCASGTGGIVVQAYNTATNYAMAFRNTSNSEVGNISFTTTATTYATSSDYRLKENVQPMQNALSVVQQLNPVTYTWKADGSDGQGFIAHELQAVVPDCVTGEKDAVDEEGNPVYQGIDTSFLVATLTKAIQELSAKNDALEARLAALEAK